MLFNVEQQNLTIILIPIILFIFFLHKWLHPRKNLPPSPPKLPILGNLHQMGSNPHQSLHTLSKTYGDLMLLYLGQSPFLVVSSANAAREILRTHDTIFASKPYMKTLERIFYKFKDVATAPYGEYWRQMKSICVLQLLSNKRVRSFRSVREEETALLMDTIRKSDGCPVNLTELFRTFTKHVISRAAFGRTYSRNQGGKDFDQKLLAEFMELVGGFRVGDLIPWLSWISRIDGWDAKIERVVREFDQFLENVIKQHQEADSLPGKVHQKDDEELKDFVDVLLQVHKEGSAGFPISRDSIKALLLDMFFAGTDTISTALDWIMSELLTHPAIMQQLKKEVRGITSNRTSNNINEDDLEQMKYMKAVINEALRLHPPNSFMARLATKDVKINGYDIPRGTNVLINIWTIQRDPSYWEHPEKFNPQRFFNSLIEFRGQDFGFTPFGSGRRICPGISFASTIIEVVLANLMLKFDWELPSATKGGDQALDMTERIGVTTHRKTPLFAIARTHNNIK